MNSDIPCYQADVERGIRIVPVSGTFTRITLLHKIIGEIKEINLLWASQVRNIFLKKVKIYNLTPRATGGTYLAAITRVYHVSSDNAELHSP